MCERYIIKDRWIVDTKLNKKMHSIDCYEEKSILDIMNEQDQRIAELEDKWNKLREWARNSTEVLLYSIGDKPAKLGNKKYNYFERKQLLDKMQELENGENK